MGLKKKLKGLDEDGIKKLFKLTFINTAITYGTDGVMGGGIKKILKSKTFKKSKYIRSIFDEVLAEMNQIAKSLEKNIEDPEERLMYLKNMIKDES